MDDPTEHYGPDFDSWAEWFAARYRLRGAQALKATLAGLVATDRCPAEYLEQAAAELAAMGLLKPGRLVHAVAAQCPPMTDLRFCDYVDNPIDTQNNVKMWLWSVEHRAKRIRKRSKELLRRAGIG